MSQVEMPTEEEIYSNGLMVTQSEISAPTSSTLDQPTRWRHLRNKYSRGETVLTLPVLGRHAPWDTKVMIPQIPREVARQLGILLNNLELPDWRVAQLITFKDDATINGLNTRLIAMIERQPLDREWIPDGIKVIPVEEIGVPFRSPSVVVRRAEPITTKWQEVQNYLTIKGHQLIAAFEHPVMNSTNQEHFLVVR